MILANVNIGTGPSAGNGDPLRSAFNKINQNFVDIQSNVNALSVSTSVSSVAGRTGNVLLTVNDIIGFSGLSLVNNTAPSSSSSTGIKGQVIVSGSYMYVCTAANTWVRSSVTTSF
jgi:hypothetical protein